MDYEYIDCIDAGTRFCPCSLAETGDCILCSCLKGKKFCDCINWKGVCIYGEFINNGQKAKMGRESCRCLIENKINMGNVFYLKVSVPHSLAGELTYAGSFVFVRNEKFESYYDTPISILEVNTEEDYIELGIEIKGTKTKAIDSAEKELMVRGPYWNGVFGVKKINSLKEKTALIISKGIGLIPVIPIIKKLTENGSHIILINDTSNLDLSYVKSKIKDYNIEEIDLNIFSNGILTEEFINILNKYKKDADLIHVSAQDIIILQISDLISDKLFTCCNNAKMCCGEGGCGACSARFAGHKVKKLCKLQIEPKYLFRERRLI
ncbi:MAG: sulfide/dihydroorotate dehydrogenase-like FAD/NAD-binding protein [Bacillota bacterium]|nr:sulfide/dihydroorotate dehydrogenase-like FAD/NAD-binding protein [Bacillota bacterium]